MTSERGAVAVFVVSMLLVLAALFGMMSLTQCTPAEEQTISKVATTVGEPVLEGVCVLVDQSSIAITLLCDGLETADKMLANATSSSIVSQVMVTTADGGTKALVKVNVPVRFAPLAKADAGAE